jgi:hypothetical protein
MMLCVDTIANNIFHVFSLCIYIFLLKLGVDTWMRLWRYIFHLLSFQSVCVSRIQMLAYLLVSIFLVLDMDFVLWACNLFIYLNLCPCFYLCKPSQRKSSW